MKDTNLKIRISEFEMRKIRAAAQAQQESTSEFMRKSADQRMVRDELREEEKEC